MREAARAPVRRRTLSGRALELLVRHECFIALGSCGALSELDERLLQVLSCHLSVVTASVGISAGGATCFRRVVVIHGCVLDIAVAMVGRFWSVCDAVFAREHAHRQLCLGCSQRRVRNFSNRMRYLVSWRRSNRRVVACDFSPVERA